MGAKPQNPVVPLQLALCLCWEHLIPVTSLRNYLRFLAAVQLLPALESGEETLVGGQAVLEGVMMRSPHAWAISVRKPSGEIASHSEPLERISDRHKWFAWPVVRGVVDYYWRNKDPKRAIDALEQAAARAEVGYHTQFTLEAARTGEKGRDPGRGVGGVSRSRGTDQRRA